MNISKPFLESMEIEYYDEVWTYPLDYDHLPFKCRLCHEYGHLFQGCPQKPKEDLPPLSNTAMDGFFSRYRTGRTKEKRVHPNVHRQPHQRHRKP